MLYSSFHKMAAKQIPGFYYDEAKKRYFQITKDFKPPPPAISVKPTTTTTTATNSSRGKQKRSHQNDHDGEKKSKCRKRADRCECLPVSLQSRSMFGSRARLVRQLKQRSLLHSMQFNLKVARDFNSCLDGVEHPSAPIASCPYNIRVSNSGRSLALHLKPSGERILQVMCVLEIH